MDSLTQIILGASTGVAVSGKKIGNKAAFWGAIGGTIPDLDVFLGLWNSPVYSDHLHRGFSHSLLFTILCSGLLTFLLYKLKPASFEIKNTYFLFLVSIGTHPLLDSFTRWGTQFLWPLDIKWHWNGVFVIDPLYTLPFGVLLILALRSKNVKRKLRFNAVGLILSTCYLFFGLTLKNIVLSKTNADYTAPMPLTNLSWMVIDDQLDFFEIGQYNVLTDHKVFTSRITKNHNYSNHFFEKPEASFEVAKSFSQNFYALSLSQNEDTLYFYDLRFGLTNSFKMDHQKGKPFRGYKFYYLNGSLINERYQATWPNDFSFSSYWQSIVQ